MVAYGGVAAFYKQWLSFLVVGGFVHDIQISYRDRSGPPGGYWATLQTIDGSSWNWVGKMLQSFLYCYPNNPLTYSYR
jgi:hypothetical protein